jgi:hypothetical protein
MSEIIKIPLNAINEWLAKETTYIIKPLRTDAKKLLKELNSKLEDLKESCEKLLEDAEKEMAKSSRKTYRRAKFLYKLSGTFTDLIDKITIPEEISGKTLNLASDQISKTLKTIIQERTKWFRAIAPYFIISRRRFDASLKRADDSFRNFTDFLSDDYIEAEQAEDVPSKVEELLHHITELNDYDKRKEARIQKKQLLETKIEKYHQKIQALQTKSEVIELAKLNSKIEELTKLVKHEIRHIQKPILKFQTLVNNPGYNLIPEANIKIDEYLTDPFKALSTEKQGYPLLKTILQKIQSALENKKMKLKTSRLKKAKDQINRILIKSTLESLQKECKRVFDQKQVLLSSGKLNEYRDEKKDLNNRLNDLLQKKSILEAKDSRIEKKYNETKRRVAKQKKDIEKIVSELSTQKIKIILD